ncbi:uncharacterized protein LOC126814978 isoform X2 [Patella vulgata]|nr:uncharacterized protein LOC126814978 isoform X2 [Patella vulgata]
MDQQIWPNQMISINEHLQQEGNKNKEIFTDSKMENNRTMKDQDSGFEVDDEEGQNIRKQELQSEKEILEEKLKRITEELGALHHDDSESVNIRCHGDANDQSSQNVSSMDGKAEQSFQVNRDHSNNNVTLNRELISSDKNTKMCPIPTDADSHIINEVDSKTAVDNNPIEEAAPSNQSSHDTNFKTVYSKDKVGEETIEEIIPLDHQRGLMTEADGWKIQRHTYYLVNELDAIELINILYSLFVYDIDDYESLLRILKREGRCKCVMNMLMILSRKGPNSYILFLLALERCGYTWIIQKLEPDCGIYEGKIKYSGQKFYELIDNTSPKYKEFVKRCENNIEQVYQDKPGQQFVVVKKLE